MPKQLSPFTTWSQYLALRSAGTLVSCFDPEPTLRAARAIAQPWRRFDRKHAQRAERAIRFCFPGWDDEQVHATVRRSFEHMAQLACETMHVNRHMTQGGWTQRIRFGDVSRVVQLLEQRQPLIMVTGHLGNWEMIGFFLSMLGYRLNALARPLDNRLINDWVMGTREQRGLKVLTKWGATEEMKRIVRTGEPLGIVADQNAGADGLFVPFFGRLASAYKSIAVFAIRYNAPVVIGYSHRINDRFEHEIIPQDIIEPSDWADHPYPTYYVTARYIRALEMGVRRQPDQYLWMHRRWKSRPKHEKQGKPAPESYRRQLASLPWLDEAAIEEALTPMSRDEVR